MICLFKDILKQMLILVSSKLDLIKNVRYTSHRSVYWQH